MKHLLLPLLLTLAACKGETPPDPARTNVGPPPAAVCADIKAQLAKLDAQPVSPIQYDDKGDATVTQETWLAMSPDQHADLARTLGFHAACAAGRQSDAQPVRIRNESGTMLLETTVSTKVDLRAVVK